MYAETCDSYTWLERGLFKNDKYSLANVRSEKVSSVIVALIIFGIIFIIDEKYSISAKKDVHIFIYLQPAV